MRFLDRTEAGQKLAAALAHYRGQAPLVLGIPRGGVPVAYEVARALEAPLDVFIARKIGCPEQPEFGIGAVAEGGLLYLDQGSLATLGLTQEELEPSIQKEEEKIEQRLQLFRGGRPLPPLEGRTVILVDDGIATGGTIKASLAALRRMHPRRLILAAPVAARETAQELEAMADELVFLQSPSPLGAIGFWYKDFEQVPDQEVSSLLDKRRAPSS